MHKIDTTVAHVEDDDAHIEDEDVKSFKRHVRIERPIYDGSEIWLSSNVWPSRCVLHSYIDGKHLGWCRLPEGNDHPRRVLGWNVSFELSVQLDRGRLSLDLEMERRDVYYEDGGVVRLLHTSNRTAVIGRARLALVDVLLRDGEEDDDEDGLPALAKGTREFDDWVRLNGLRFPAQGPPVNVVRGGLSVRMSLEEEKN